MASFSDSYLGRLRELVGSRLLLVPGARIIIQNGAGNVLLQRRSDFRVWGLPGGNAEEGETLEEVVIREVEEEMGIKVDELRPIGFGCDPAYETHVFPNGDQCQYFCLVFHTRSFRGEPVVNDDESIDVGWFSMNDLPDMLPNMRRSVEAYQRYEQTGEFQII
ncbi:NUDIX domain-containing protein [Achromobacter sp. MFA1 R4]|uniref:NUDIX domain-containing protein n=1 Tax=Achromobacter sp. MFA1 R4 TaxID=1881016 RepID=UPI0009539691|nr:NUDIX domain-containing protein [Achromobacter sp. MFA1 R4]SIT23643.1 ADP-ribose pyrophosphatase YjhB, NUDIX family [Achromobacter sp. MFA1 R4]